MEIGLVFVFLGVHPCDGKFLFPGVPSARFATSVTVGTTLAATKFAQVRNDAFRSTEGVAFTVLAGVKLINRVRSCFLKHSLGLRLVHQATWVIITNCFVCEAK